MAEITPFYAAVNVLNGLARYGRTFALQVSFNMDALAMATFRDMRPTPMDVSRHVHYIAQDAAAKIEDAMLKELQTKMGMPYGR